MYIYNAIAVGIDTDDSLELTGQEAKSKAKQTKLNKKERASGLESDFLLDNKVEAWRDDSVEKKPVLFCKPEDLSLAPRKKLGMVVCASVTSETFAVNGKYFVLSSCCVS